MNDRRRVHVNESFLIQLDSFLPDDRGPLGRPSRLDFLVYELPDAIDAFATHWEALMPVEPGLERGRVVVRAGALVPFYAIYGILLPDDTIEVVGITMQLDER